MAHILRATKQENGILVTVRGFNGEPKERFINCTVKEYEEWLISGKYIQDAMPNTSADDREFLISGTTPEEWDEMFAKQKD